MIQLKLISDLHLKFLDTLAKPLFPYIYIYG